MTKTAYLFGNNCITSRTGHAATTQSKVILLCKYQPIYFTLPLTKKKTKFITCQIAYVHFSFNIFVLINI